MTDWGDDVSAQPARQAQPPSETPLPVVPDGPASPARPASERGRLRRKRERGSHDRAVIDAILDEALIAHLGIVEEDGQPIVTPTLHARDGDLFECHAAAPSGTLGTLE